jgi:uncharacterized protein YggT (Ycf19 family)
VTELATAALLFQQFGFSIAELLANIVRYSRTILIGLILAWVLIGWFPGYPSTRFFQVIYDVIGAVVNPIMAPLSSRIPTLQLGGIGINLAPIIAIFAISIAATLLLSIIKSFIEPITG